MFYLHPSLEKVPILTSIFFSWVGKNHQLSSKWSIGGLGLGGFWDSNREFPYKNPNPFHFRGPLSKQHGPRAVRIPEGVKLLILLLLPWPFWIKVSWIAVGCSAVVFGFCLGFWVLVVAVWSKTHGEWLFVFAKMLKNVKC